MLAVSPIRSTKDESQGEMESFSVDDDDFADLSDRNLLESINFDDLFVDINLPDLDMDSEIFAELSAGGGDEESEMTWLENKVDNNPTRKKEEDDKVSSINSGTGLGSGSGSNAGSSRGDQEIVSKRDESVVVNPSPKEVEKGRKSSSAQSKNNSQGKRKVKVDWTPELHKRFVQAVEKLGVDKAVPSRILEIMGIDCLTRHNIASHLQKYRSHRKNLLAREVEAASWSQRCQIYGVATAGGGGGCGGKRDISPWLAPTMGFPPMTPIHHVRGLHVWGHPSMDQPFMHMYPPSPPPTAWAPPVAPPPHPPPALDPSYWHSFHQRGQNALTPAIPYFAQPLTATKFASPLVPGIPPPPHAMYKVDAGGIGLPTRQSGPRTLLDLHPSKESIDAAIGDALSKPWLPLPLGLRAPALDSVMGEFQRQGIFKIPPSFAKP